MWCALTAWVSFSAPKRIVYIYMASTLISVVLNYLASITYDRDVITICANQGAQAILRFILTYWF